MDTLIFVRKAEQWLEKKYKHLPIFLATPQRDHTANERTCQELLTRGVYVRVVTLTLKRSWKIAIIAINTEG
jgi:hypothetical protein